MWCRCVVSDRWRQPWPPLLWRQKWSSAGGRLWRKICFDYPPDRLWCDSPADRQRLPESVRLSSFCFSVKEKLRLILLCRNVSWQERLSVQFKLEHQWRSVDNQKTKQNRDSSDGISDNYRLCQCKTSRWHLHTRAVRSTFISNTATGHHLSCSQCFITEIQCG